MLGARDRALSRLGVFPGTSPPDPAPRTCRLARRRKINRLLGLKVIEEWVLGGDPARIEAAGELAAECPVSIMLEQPEFSVTLIEQADVRGTALGGRVVAALLGGTHVGGWARQPGSPSDLHLRQLSVGRTVSATLPEGSAPRAAYEQLAAMAQTEIDETMRADEEERWLV